MDLLDLKVGGVAIGILLGILGTWYLISSIFKYRREQRALRKELDEAEKKFRDELVWKPRMVGGIDCGEWVRKDGRPIED
jgi:hypothetical protein